MHDDTHRLCDTVDKNIETCSTRCRIAQSNVAKIARDENCPAVAMLCSPHRDTTGHRIHPGCPDDMSTAFLFWPAAEILRRSNRTPALMHSVTLLLKGPSCPK